MSANSIAVELFNQGLLPYQKMIDVVEFGNKSMLCRVQIKDKDGVCFLGADYTLAKEYLEYGKSTDLAKALTTLINEKVNRITPRFKNGYADVECWEYSPSGEYQGMNKIIKTVRIAVNPHKFNLGVLEFMVDKN